MSNTILEALRLLKEPFIINENFKNGYVEKGKPLDLSKARMIKSDVMDIRGELEESACLEYNGVLTRVAA